MILPEVTYKTENIIEVISSLYKSNKPNETTSQKKKKRKMSMFSLDH